MRLIDADKLNEELYKAVMEMNGYRAQGFEIARNIVNKQDTAYDVEKVAEELQGLRNAEADYYYANSNDVIDREDAIEIVRKGGVE